MGGDWTVNDGLNGNTQGEYNADLSKMQYTIIIITRWM